MRVNLYLSDTTSSEIDFAVEIKSFLEDTFSVEVDLRGDFFQEHPSDDVPHRLARMRVRHPLRREFREPHPVEVEAERRRLREPMGIVYDGVEFLKLCLSLRGVRENEYDIIVTNRLLATYSDGRYHLRMVVMGPLAAISFRGIWDAPAPPAKCYIRQVCSGLPRDAVATEPPDREKAMKMLLSQILFYRAFGMPFCDVPTCMLKNPHRWEEFGEVEDFCPRHRAMLEELPWKRR
jgi:hypothetical protein